MVDIYKWYRCTEDKPPRKGEYLLLVGTKTIFGFHHTKIVLSKWNGHCWNVEGSHIRWAYITKKNKDLYRIGNTTETVRVI